MTLNRNMLQAALDGINVMSALNQRFASVEGFLQPIEGFTLYWLAKNLEVSGETVEIGSFKGRSTCWLAQALQDLGNGQVSAVDHFVGSPEHQKGKQFEDGDIAASGSTLEKFNMNINQQSLSDRVKVFAGDSTEIGRAWTSPIRLLFIDGDHSYEATKRDFEVWSPNVLMNGVVAFHDVGGWPGVTRFFDELVANDKNWSYIGRVHSVGIVERVGR